MMSLLTVSKALVRSIKARKRCLLFAAFFLDEQRKHVSRTAATPEVTL